MTDSMLIDMDIGQFFDKLQLFTGYMEMSAACFGEFAIVSSDIENKLHGSVMNHDEELGLVYAAALPIDEMRKIVRMPGYKEAAQYVKQNKPLESVRMAEIGGTILEKIMQPIGATVDSMNARTKSYDCIIEDPRKFVTLEEYEKTFPGKYDITFTNSLFDVGSSINMISNKGPYGERNAMEELLAVFSNITKSGGLSIHGKVGLNMFADKLDYLGFDLVKETEFQAVILQKREPNLKRFPKGFMIYDNAFIDFQDGKFCYNGPNRILMPIFR